MDLLPFKELIRQRCGLIFEGSSEELLTGAIDRRLIETRTRDHNGYYTRLYSDGSEFQALVNLLTINETYFFREPEHLRLLTDRVIPRLLTRKRPGQPIRILSAGCSSGEEPYSLVMALQEKYGDATARLFTVLGGDIDDEALARARCARYAGLSFRSLAPQLRDRYFDADGPTWLVKPHIRAQVSLHHLNLLAESLPAALHGVDVIFFRNVSIYFDRPTRHTIQQRLAELLEPEGVLLVSAAETLANDFGLLSLVEEDGIFYFTNEARPPHAPVHETAVPLPAIDWPEPTCAPAPVVTCEPVPADTPDAVESALRLIGEKRYEEALERLAAAIELDPRDARPHLLRAHLLLNRQQFASAEIAAEQALALDPWHADAFVLLGLAAKWRGQPEPAIRWFKQAVYARPECWVAHYYLAEMHRASGNLELAQREYRVVLQQLSRGGSDGGLTVVPMRFPVAELRLLCERHLRNEKG